MLALKVCSTTHGSYKILLKKLLLVRKKKNLSESLCFVLFGRRSGELGILVSLYLTLKGQQGALFCHPCRSWSRAANGVWDSVKWPRSPPVQVLTLWGG